MQVQFVSEVISDIHRQLLIIIVLIQWIRIITVAKNSKWSIVMRLTFQIVHLIFDKVHLMFRLFVLALIVFIMFVLGRGGGGGDKCCCC